MTGTLNLSRRLFLAGAATSTVAAAFVGASMPAIPDAAAAMESAPVAPKAVDYPLRYWTGDGERFGCDFDTLEEAMAYARHNGDAEVLLARQQDIPYRIDRGEIDALFDHFDEAYSDYTDPDGDMPSLDATGDQLDELAREFDAVFQRWIDRHQLSKTAWLFSEADQQRFKVEQANDGSPAILGRSATVIVPDEHGFNGEPG